MEFRLILNKWNSDWFSSKYSWKGKFFQQQSHLLFWLEFKSEFIKEEFRFNQKNIIFYGISFDFKQMEFSQIFVKIVLKQAKPSAFLIRILVGINQRYWKNSLFNCNHLLQTRIHIKFCLLINFLCWGAFNNYVDKMRGGGGQKKSVFVHAQGIKTVHVVVEWPLSWQGMTKVQCSEHMKSN